MMALDPIAIADFFPAAFGFGGGVVGFLALAFGSGVDAATFLRPYAEAALLGAYYATSGGSPTVDP
jgi:hypothetical protein